MQYLLFLCQIIPFCLSQLFRFCFRSCVILPFIVTDEKLAESSASIAVLVSQAEATDEKLAESSASIVVLVSQVEATKFQLSSLKIELTETKKKLESVEKVIRRQGEIHALDETEASTRDTEGVLETFRSLYEETKELRMELKVEKEKHRVELEQMMAQLEETKSMRTLGEPTVVTLSTSAVRNEFVIKDSSPSLKNRSRKRTR